MIRITPIQHAATTDYSSLTDFTDQTAGIVPERNPVITSVSRVLMLDTAQTPNDPADYSAPSPEESQYEGLYQAF